MHLLPIYGFIIWTALTLAAPPPSDRPSGDLKSLREMVRKEKYLTVNPDTLPFPALKEPNMYSMRRSACAECMWQLLMLHLEERGPEAYLFQQHPEFGLTMRRGNMMRYEMEWFYYTADGGFKRLGDATMLSKYCTTLMQGLDDQLFSKCYWWDWDQELSTMYDPETKVRVYSLDETQTQEDSSMFDDPYFSAKVQLPKLANDMKQRLPLLADGLRKQVKEGARNTATGALVGFNRAVAAQRFRPVMPKWKFVP
ncbi:MAG: hypothetical protein M1823_006182 [Watsoniomyces obsoletus]|nr:MAG: hypothetical protein M1823_006182 [Watsoniomyces obsoletus]